MWAGIDRTADIVKQAVAAVEQGGTATYPAGSAGTPPRGGGGTASGNGAGIGGVSLRDGQGRMKWMWGVSVFSDNTSSGDVFSDE